MKIASLLLALFLVAPLAACGTAAPAATGTPQPVAPTATQASATQSVAATQTPTAIQSSTATEVPPSQPAATATTPPRQILIDAPAPGAMVSSPLEVRGSVSVSPFESTLRWRVYDAAGQVVGQGPIMVDAEMGQPGSFADQIAFTVSAGGPGRLEIAEESAKDGSVVVSASVDVVLVAPAVSSGIEIPKAGAQAVLPLHILARVGLPGEQATATLLWQDGTILEGQFRIQAGEDGRGLLIGSLDWMMEGPPPQPPSQPATLAIRSQDGQLLAEQAVTILSAGDPNVTTVTLYFLLGEDLQATQRHIVKTEAIGTAALNELLWGPPPNNLAGFETAIPDPEEVLAYAGRGAGWGPRVRLLKLTIVDGLATADFSKELQAYGGGSLRVKLLHDQIVMTLLQFSTVREVVIAVEGQTEGVLQP